MHRRGLALHAKRCYLILFEKGMYFREREIFLLAFMFVAVCVFIRWYCLNSEDKVGLFTQVVELNASFYLAVCSV